MQFIDPMQVTCEKCGYIDEYPLESLTSYSACCNNCGSKVDHAGISINEAKREHLISTWPFYFLVDMLEQFHIDLDEISDEECENIQTLGDLIKTIEEKLNTDEMVKDKVLDSDDIKTVISEYHGGEILNAKLSEIAGLIYDHG